MQPIIEIAVAVCDITRLLTPQEFASEGEQHEIERLRERGITLDPFDTRSFSQRTRYAAASVAEWPEDFDPFDVGDLVEPEEQTIEWAPEDRAAAAKFARASRLRTLTFLELRDPFRITGGQA